VVSGVETSVGMSKPDLMWYYEMQVGHKAEVLRKRGNKRCAADEDGWLKCQEQHAH
jgi:hypothetical protein